MAAGSKTVIYAALIGNGLISITKFTAAALTGSSAMLSEGVHSLVDTGNQVLLLYGIKRASRPADARHPFGYGAEIYFWAFVVAILIFAVGAGVSIYEGIEKLRHPHPIANPIINYVVLILAMAFEAVAWWIAFRAFEETRGDMGWLEAVRTSKDPTIFTVLFEDTAAMLGLVVAFVGIFAAANLGVEWADGAASVVIGFILAGAALLLAIETKGLLIGEAASPEVEEEIRQIVAATPSIRALNEIRTLHRGPQDVLLAISVDFEDDLTSGDVERGVQTLERTIRGRFLTIRRLFVEAQSEEGHRESQAALRTEAAPPAAAGH